MKRCPECRQDYSDDSLLYCLSDGAPLLAGLGSGIGQQEEPATAILHSGDAPTGAVAPTALVPRYWLWSTIALTVLLVVLNWTDQLGETQEAR